MGCCSPNYQKQVEQQEEEVNQSQNVTVPFWMKVISLTVVLLTLVYYWL